MLRVLTVACALLLPQLAAAQEASAEADMNDQEAHARFVAGEIAFAAGRFDDALSDFQRAYELSQRPQLLYNIGLAAYRTRDDALATQSFERFIAELPDHENTDQARARLRQLEAAANAAGDESAGAGAEESAGAGAEESETQTPREPRESPSRVGPLTLGIAGGAAVVGGAVLLALALSDKSDVESMETVEWSAIRNQVESVPRRSGAGIALIAVGAAAAIGAVVWRVVTPDTSLALQVSPTGAQLRGSF